MVCDDVGILGTPGSRAERTLRLLEEGFKAVKLRLRADTVQGDVVHVAAVRAAGRPTRHQPHKNAFGVGRLRPDGDCGRRQPGGRGPASGF